MTNVHAASVRHSATPGQADDRVLCHRDIQVELDAYRVTCRGRTVKIAYREFRLLCILVQNPEQVHSREDLISLAWPPGTKIKPSAINTYILRLRKCLNSCGCCEAIETVRGVGYRVR